MTIDAVTPPGVAAVVAKHFLADLDPNHGPVGWLMREDGSQVCDVYRPLDVWNENALRCTSSCHLEEPTGGRAGPAPPLVPEPRGPDTWPGPRDIPPPPPRPIPDGRQLGLYDPPWSTP